MTEAQTHERDRLIEHSPFKAGRPALEAPGHRARPRPLGREVAREHRQAVRKREEVAFTRDEFESGEEGVARKIEADVRAPRVARVLDEQRELGIDRA